jgi:hypothetical protein
MTGRSTLEIIADKERELRGLLLAARARADTLVAEAHREAAQMKTAQQARAETEVMAQIEEEVLAVRRGAESLAGGSLAELDLLTEDSSCVSTATQMIVDAVLLRSQDRCQTPWHAPVKGKRPSVGARE